MSRLAVAGVDLGARFSWQAVRRYEFGLDYLLAHEVERARVEARRRMRRTERGPDNSRVFKDNNY